MFLFNCVILYFVLFPGQILCLVELPQVDDNNILATETAIRVTINTLFYKLGLRGIKTKPRLKEYSTVHNHLVSFTLQDYTNLKEIAKLTRVDKTKINNETRSFMAVINDILNEDIVEEKAEGTITEANDESVINYIDGFLSKLESLKEEYGVTNEKFHINDDLYQVLRNDGTFFYNFTMEDTDFEDNDTLIEESNFWKPDLSGRRVYRGDRTKIKYFPFMASIQIFNRFHCSGSIIKSDLVITASSCLQLAWNNRFFRENPAFLSVRVGSNFYNGGGENIPVLEVYFHPKYNPRNLWNNICLMRLVRNLHFDKKSRRVKKIDFDRNPSNLPMTTDGITIVGWGARGTSNIVKNPWENVLAFAVLDVYPLKECQDIYSREYVTKKNFCAGFFSKGGGACNRDVGGPGIVNGILMGVVSFGSPVCGAPDAPTVFTKLGYYTDWIEEIMEMDVPNIRQRTTLKPKMDFYTIGQYYRPIEPTTFKIPPLQGKLKPIPISEVDALRMLQKGDLFKEFLSTMFGDNEAEEYQDLLNNAQPQKDRAGPVLEETSLSTPPIDLPVQSEENTDDQVQDVTEMGVVEPAQDTTANQVTSLDESFVGINNDKNLETELINLIDDIDLKEIIDGMPSVEEDKLLEDDKIIDIFNEKENEKKIAKMDDSVLTLLYLSDSEKNANTNDKRDMSVNDYEEDEDDNVETGGLSIQADDFRDLTYRNKYNTSAVKYGVTKHEMYYLITEAIAEAENENDE